MKMGKPITDLDKEVHEVEMDLIQMDKIHSLLLDQLAELEGRISRQQEYKQQLDDLILRQYPGPSHSLDGLDQPLADLGEAYW